MRELSEIPEDIIERVAIEYHNFDGDDDAVKWGKCKSNYRGSVRKRIRTVIASAERAGLSVLTKSQADASRASIAEERDRLREGINELADVMRSIAADCQGASVCGEPEMGLEAIFHKACDGLTLVSHIRDSATRKGGAS